MPSVNYTKQIHLWDKNHSGKGQSARTMKSETKIKILNIDFTCNSVLTPPISGNVYWAVFAGRRDRLEVQERYWHYLYKVGLLTEVHLWDFTSIANNATEAQLNQEWIESRAKQYEYITIKGGKVNKTCVDLWNAVCFLDFYEYYAENLAKLDVLVKVDDDILWVNVSEFKCFVQYVFHSKDEVLVSANIVNNGVVAHMQQQLGMIPESVGKFEYPWAGRTGTLYFSIDKALNLHKYFLLHKEKFYKEKVLVQYFERLSINFFGVNYYHAKEAFQMVKYVFEHQKYFQGAKDETALTTFANVHLNTKQVIYMRLVVAHGTFMNQWLASKKLTADITEMYQKENMTDLSRGSQ